MNRLKPVTFRNRTNKIDNTMNAYMHSRTPQQIHDLMISLRPEDFYNVDCIVIGHDDFNELQRLLVQSGRPFNSFGIGVMCYPYSVHIEFEMKEFDYSLTTCEFWYNRF
jgi:hypothetical protein